MAWQQDADALRAGGFSEPEIARYGEEQRATLAAAGFSDTEIGEYFGVKEFQPGRVRQVFESGLRAAQEQNLGEDGQPKRELSFTDYLDAGWQTSVSGLLARQKAPTAQVPQDAPMWGRLVSQGAALAGDLPFMAAGGVVGGAAGSAAPVVGTTVGAGAGAFALPAAMREALMQSYEKGEVRSWGDFYDRASAVFLETLKGAVVGGATTGLGAAAKVAVGARVAAPLASEAAGIATEVATMTTLGAALEGHAPEPNDFLDAAVLVFGLRGATAGAAKLRDIYAKTGIRPEEVAQDAQREATIKQDLYASNRDVPGAYEAKVERPADFAAEPPLRPGFVRVYHSGAKGEGDTGRWVSTERKYAADYRKDQPLFYLDIESTDPRVVHPDYPDEYSVARGNWTTNFELTPEEATRLTEVSREQNPPPPGPEGPKGPDAPPPEPPMERPRDVSMQAPEAYATDAEALDAAKAHVLSRISIGESTKEPWSFRDFYKNTVDDLDAVARAVESMAGGKELAPSEDAYKLARLTRGAAGKAFAFLEKGTFDYETLGTNGEPLKAVASLVQTDRVDFTRYVVARQALEEHARGRETGIDPYAAALVVKDGQAKYEAVAEGLRQYNARMLRYMADAGFFSRETVDKMIRENQTYTPFHRVIEERAKKGGGLGAGFTVRDPVKRRKGSDLRILDPIETTVKNTYLFTALADRNATLRAYVELAEKTPGGEFFARKVQGGGKPGQVGEMTTDLALLSIGESVPEDVASPFRPYAFSPAHDEIAVFRNGRREVWRVGPEVASAFKGLDVETAPWLVQILSKPAQTLRAGAVLAPDFALRNVVRDTAEAFINSKTGFVPVLDTVRGVMSMAKQDQYFEQWLKAGGANAATTSLDRPGLQRQLDRMLGDPGAGVIDKTWNVVKTPYHLLQALSELLENATRLGEFRKSKTGAEAKGASGKDAILGAGFDSREVTFDFGRMGAKMKAANMLVAFMNANIQGTDKLLRTFKDNPFGATAKAVAAITLPSVLLYAANRGDKRWDLIPDWQKDNFWIVMTGDEKSGRVFRIPKPHTVGLLFGSAVERVLDAYFGDNPKAFKNFQWTIFSAVAPNVVPTVAQPILEQWANRSFFTGQNLVPAGLEQGLPEYQYSDYTTELSKLVGRMVAAVPGMHESQAASPMVLDNYVRNWTGTVGVYTWQITDKLLREAAKADTALGKALQTLNVQEKPQPAATLADIPVVKAFIVRHPSASAQVIQDFHDEYERHKKIQHTVRMLAQRGDVDAVQKEQALNLRESTIKLDGFNNALGAARRQLQALSLLPDQAKDPVNGISADERRQLIDGVYFQMIEMARGGMQMIRAIDQGLGGQ